MVLLMVVSQRLGFTHLKESVGKEATFSTLLTQRIMLFER